VDIPSESVGVAAAAPGGGQQEIHGPPALGARDADLYDSIA